MSSDLSYFGGSAERRIEDWSSSLRWNRLNDAAPLRRKSNESPTDRIVSGMDSVLEVTRSGNDRTTSLLNEHRSAGKSIDRTDQRISPSIDPPGDSSLDIYPSVCLFVRPFLPSKQSIPPSHLLSIHPSFRPSIHLS